MSKNVLKSILFNSKGKAMSSSVTVSVVSSQFTVLMLRDRRIYFHLSFVQQQISYFLSIRYAYSEL